MPLMMKSLEACKQSIIYSSYSTTDAIFPSPCGSDQDGRSPLVTVNSWGLSLIHKGPNKISHLSHHIGQKCHIFAQKLNYYTIKV